MLWFKRIQLLFFGVPCTLVGGFPTVALVLFVSLPDAGGNRVKIVGYALLPSLAVLILGLACVLAVVRSFRSGCDQLAQLRIPRGLVVGLVVITPLPGVVIWQYSVFEEDMTAFAEIRHAQESQSESAQAARMDPKSVEAEIARIDLEIHRLESVIPVRQDVDVFVSALETWLAGRELVLCEMDPHRVVDRESFSEIVLEPVFCGRQELLSALAAHPASLARCCGSRLVMITEMSLTDHGLRAVLVIFSRHGFGAVERHDWCREDQWPEVRCWMWPFRGRANAARERLKELCPELAEKREFIDLVEDLHASERHLLWTKHLVEDLRRAQAQRLRGLGSLAEGEGWALPFPSRECAPQRGRPERGFERRAGCELDGRTVSIPPWLTG